MVSIFHWNFLEETMLGASVSDGEGFWHPVARRGVPIASEAAPALIEVLRKLRLDCSFMVSQVWVNVWIIEYCIIQ